MTPQEVHAACKALGDEIGPHARIWTSIDNDHDTHPVSISVKPFGLCDDRGRFSFRGDTFEEVLSKSRAKWAEKKAQHEAALVRRMALAIIGIAGDGKVTDQALSHEGFNLGEIAKYGAAACAEATRLAGNAPFTIETVPAAAKLRLA